MIFNSFIPSSEKCITYLRLAMPKALGGDLGGGRFWGNTDARINLRRITPWKKRTSIRRKCLSLNQTNILTTFKMLSPHSPVSSQTLYLVPFYQPSSPPNSYSLYNFYLILPNIKPEKLVNLNFFLFPNTELKAKFLWNHFHYIS